MFFTTLFSSVVHAFPSPEIYRGDAISSVRFLPVLLRAWPLSEQVADCGTRATALSVQSRG